MTRLGLVPLGTITSYLDSYLRIGQIPDEGNAVNGLQVENRGSVSRLIAAVDASQRTIDDAVKSGGNCLLLVHHGMLWDGNVPVIGRRHRRLQALMENDIALYSAHIPLDVHPEVGNNAVLLRGLGAEPAGTFGEYKGIQLGVWGELDLSREELSGRVDSVLGSTCRVIPGGPRRCGRVGVITGAGGSMIRHAIAAGLDTFISGEGAHHTYFDATEGGINVLYAGHYATEKLGVQALARHLSARFGIDWEFSDHDTGL